MKTLACTLATVFALSIFAAAASADGYGSYNNSYGSSNYDSSNYGLKPGQSFGKKGKKHNFQQQNFQQQNFQQQSFQQSFKQSGKQSFKQSSKKNYPSQFQVYPSQSYGGNNSGKWFSPSQYNPSQYESNSYDQSWNYGYSY
jgi:hypothetical protein